MIAFSRVPPQTQEFHLTTQFELPIESVITVNAINQSHHKRVIINAYQKTHVIANPNQLACSKKDVIEITSDQVQNNKCLNEEDNITTLNPITNIQANHQSEIPSLNSVQQNKEKLEQSTHIVFVTQQQRKAIIIHKNPIFNQHSQHNQSNLAQSHANPNQEVLQSHIQCTLFGNSNSKSHQIDHYQTKQPFNHKNLNISSTNNRQKSKSTFLKAQSETSDKELYEQYHRNKNKVKHLGGRKSSTTKNQCKLNLKPVKLQITKITSIQPIIF